MPIQKLFATSNKVGHHVKHKRGTSEVSSQIDGGVCLAMVLTWIKEASLAEAAHKPMTSVEPELTGYGLHIIAIRHHSLKARKRIGRSKGYTKEQQAAIDDDYLASFSLSAIPMIFDVDGPLAGFAIGLMFPSDGYYLLTITDALANRVHSMGIKYVDDGASYFLDPNSGLFQGDDGFEIQEFIIKFVAVNYIARGYVGGSYVAEKLSL